MKARQLVIVLLLFYSANFLAQNADIRLKTNFDFEWKFSLSDKKEYAEKNYNDQSWENVELPHDWNIKQKFVKGEGGAAAYLPEGTGWYRKTFHIPTSYKGKKISILFDGIFHQSDVYINGQHLGFRPYGFCSIEYDLTPYLILGGNNVIAVRATTIGDRPRWYAGAGIYRHVWLQTMSPIHIPTYGTYITTPTVGKEKADLEITTTVCNTTSQEEQLTIFQRVLNTKGKQVCKIDKKKIKVPALQSIDLKQKLSLANPQLWSIETPIMYQMETIIKQGNKIIDQYTTPFGIRTFKFDPNKGFFLNGKSVKLKGMCLHQDAGCMGVAVPERSDERRLEILKEYGCNAIRCAHNQPSPEFLDLCDRMGFVVIDEAFDKWKSGYYEQYFDKWWQKDLENMILRDRNHPSIILWSIGNEVQEAWNGGDTGVKRAKMLQDFVHKLEPTRPVTLAAQNGHQDKFAGVTDVIGYNYLEARMLNDHKKYPNRCFLVSEELPYFSGEEGNIRSYTPYNPWNIVAGNDFIAGGFIWSGVDYLGEAGWPSKGWPNGLFDICMFEKPRATYHRAMWNDTPIVRIAVVDPSLDIDHGRDLWQWPNMAAHWNFPGHYYGLVMEVRTTTNCEKVEMFMNGKSMGIHETSKFSNNTIVWHIPFRPGTLEAKGYNGGKEVASYKLTTSKNTSKAIVKADRTKIKADGQDLSHIVIHLEDVDGNLVQTDDKWLTVNVEGEGKLKGIDNGDLRREKSFTGNTLKTYFGKALVIVQSTRKAGTMHINIKMEGKDEPYIVEVQTLPLN